MEKLVIIGGGISGLSCLNTLLDNQFSPLLIEGDHIGSPKMCGEFLAPLAVHLLEQWEIGPIKYIHQARFHSAYSHLNFIFQPLAGAMMRSEAEHQLAARAYKLSGRIRENTRVTKIIPATTTSPYSLLLESGELIKAEAVIFATGKLGQAHSPKIILPYYGIKFYVNKVISHSTLQMYSAPGAYFGIVPISSTQSNLTCLLKRSKIINENYKFSFTQIIKNFPTLNIFLKDSDLEQGNWLNSPSSNFTKKILPPWPNAYWIGDALASLPPAIGCGFAYSVSSGILAADYFLHKNSHLFASMLSNEVNKKMLLGKFMHYILLHPYLTSAVFPLLQSSSWFLNKCLKRLGYKGM